MRIAIVGGGASGMLASIILAKFGAEVVLFEKNEKLGKKIYITGKGRCNLTNLCSPDEFLKNVVSNPKFLFSAIHKFSPNDCFDYFESLGLPLVIERGNRVFPASQKASDVTKTLEREMKRLGVKVKLDTEVKAISEAKFGYDIITQNEKLNFSKVIIATGGLSYPSTGSTGDGMKFAKMLGHKVIEPRQALVQILTDEDVSSLEGLSLKNVTLTAFSADKIIASEFGEMLFTKRGLSGPIALTLSSLINRLSYITLKLDLKPALDNNTLDLRLLREFKESQNCKLQTVMHKLLPSRLVDFVLNFVNLDGDKVVNEISREERMRLLLGLKGLEFKFKKLGGFEEAVITSGGVSVLDLKPTMESRFHTGLYFVGETVDVDALTGGFNLQIAYSTAYAAAVDIAKEI
ncbi:MAG TPA: NAD(P)/FAD-dependent oxidoreductase [Clostridia bacterium]|nr:NAD(P)/FAD-dependent oxidoreductase [Clostridia bacterium]